MTAFDVRELLGADAEPAPRWRLPGHPPLILATTAAASGMEASVFFTFHGLNIVHRDFERSSTSIRSATRRCPCRCASPTC
jgi:hypothetical protein